MPSQDQIRKLADNAWLLLVSRAVAPLMVPVLLGAFAWVWFTESRIAVLETRQTANMIAVARTGDTMALLPQTYASRADMVALEGRTERSFDILLTEIRGLREDVRDLNRERRE